MDKGNLLQLLQKDEDRKIDMLDMIDMTRQSACGMSYLEDKKIVHRDLALSNYFIFYFYLLIFIYFYLFIFIYLFMF